MKKLLCSLLIGVTLSTIMISPIKASTIASSDLQTYEQHLNAPDYYTEDYQGILKEKGDAADLYLLQKDKLRAGGRRTVSVPGYLQSNSYYCGPASVQNVLSKINGSSPSQSALASSMGTSSSYGTYVYKVANELASRTGFNYVSQSVYDRSVGNSVVSSIDSGYIPIYNVDTKTLNSNYAFSSGHYIVGTGYDYSASGSSGYSSIQYFDVYYGSAVTGYHWTTVTNMDNAIKANLGYYIW